MLTRGVWIPSPMSEGSTSTRLESHAIGTAEHFRWLDGILKSLLILNLLDAVFTLTWVRTGLAEEANAFLRDLVNEQALAFVLAKLGLVSLGALLLWRRRNHPLSVIAIFMAFLAYYLVLLQHLEFSSRLIQGFFGS